MHHPGVEPGSRAWKAHILTVGLMVRICSAATQIHEALDDGVRAFARGDPRTTQTKRICTELLYRGMMSTRDYSNAYSVYDVYNRCLSRSPRGDTFEVDPWKETTR